MTSNECPGVSSPNQSHSVLSPLSSMRFSANGIKDILLVTSLAGWAILLSAYTIPSVLFAVAYTLDTLPSIHWKTRIYLLGAYAITFLLLPDMKSIRCCFRMMGELVLLAVWAVGSIYATLDGVGRMSPNEYEELVMKVKCAVVMAVSIAVGFSAGGS